MNQIKETLVTLDGIPFPIISMESVNVNHNWRTNYHNPIQLSIVFYEKDSSGEKIVCDGEPKKNTIIVYLKSLNIVDGVQKIELSCGGM
jgi:hypothetical protein